MTEFEKRWAQLLFKCKVGQSEWAGPFILHMVAIATGKLKEEVTEKQRDSLVRLAWRFRRQWRFLDEAAWGELFDRRNPAAMALPFDIESCEVDRGAIRNGVVAVRASQAARATHNALERVHG